MEHNIAYIVVPGAQAGNRIAFVTFREDGYTPTTFDYIGMDPADCEQIVNNMNALIGVTPAVANSMLAGSMFGWHVPAAQLAIAQFSLLADLSPCDERSRS